MKLKLVNNFASHNNECNNYTFNKLSLNDQDPMKLTSHRFIWISWSHYCISKQNAFFPTILDVQNVDLHFSSFQTNTPMLILNLLFSLLCQKIPAVLIGSVHISWSYNVGWWCCPSTKWCKICKHAFLVTSNVNYQMSLITKHCHVVIKYKLSA
jgi:hypothetical protein